MRRISIFGLMIITVIFFIGCSAKTEVKPDDVAKLKSDNASLKSDNASLTSQNKDLNDRLAKMQDDYSNSMANIDSLNKEVNLDKDQLSTMQDQRDKMLKSLTKLSNDNTTLKNLVDSAKGDLGKQIDKLKSDLSDSGQKIKALQDQISSKDSQIVSLEDQIKSLSAEQAKIAAEKDAEISNLSITSGKLIDEMKDEIANGDIKIKQLGDTLDIDFLDKIFFDTGKADIKKNGQAVLQRVVKTLKNVKDKQIRIEGYTDNVPIADKYKWKFPSNWELSTARATTIVRYLQSQGIDPTQLKATGYGEYNPVASNDTEEGRAQNRRITIQLIPLDIRARYR